MHASSSALGDKLQNLKHRGGTLCEHFLKVSQMILVPDEVRPPHWCRGAWAWKVRKLLIRELNKIS